MRLNRYLQPYIQPCLYIACTALTQAFKISVLKTEFALLDNIGLQVACSRAAQWQTQHAVVLVFAAFGFKEKKIRHRLWDFYCC